MKNKEKVTFIDFRAILCNPCLSAMRESKSVKEEFQNKDVVFVYIADTSSPRKTREQKISEIKGEHYCLSQKGWTEILSFYEFSMIPTYIIYDKREVLRYKPTLFMGVKNINLWINNLLNEE